MIFESDVDCLIYPVRATLRNGQSLVVREDGKVFCGENGMESKLLASCAPQSPAFRPFMVFWAVIFVKNHLSVAFNQMVSDMLSGSMEQDRDCPNLFIDKLDCRVSDQDSKA